MILGIWIFGGGKDRFSLLRGGKPDALQNLILVILSSPQGEEEQGFFVFIKTSGRK